MSLILNLAVISLAAATPMMEETTEPETSAVEEDTAEAEEKTELEEAAEWMRNALTAGIAGVSANAAVLLGMAIGLVKTRAKRAADEARHQKEMAALANALREEARKCYQDVAKSMSDTTERVTAAIEQAGLEKSAAELIAGTSAKEKVSKILGGDNAGAAGEVDE